MTRRLGLALSALLLLGAAASAQEYPNRPISLIVPTSPGGTTDTLARIFAPAMSTVLGQEVVVDNRPGAANLIGTQLIAEAEPDGYTIGIGAISGLVLAPITSPDVAYDPVTDFVPVYYLANVANLLVVNAELGPRSTDELIALANERPGELNYSSGGTGTISHFAGAMFASLGGIADKTVHIPYQGGGNASVAAAAGEVQLYAGPLASNLLGVIDAGKVVPLAISGDDRVDILPDVPTFAEAGMPEYTAVAFFGIVAPAGTPPEIVARLTEAATEAAETADVQAGLAAQGIPFLKATPEEFAARVKADLQSYRKLVDDGIVTIE
jgi:tripartite-type tricarboxylate transporter receptor subunit TctC